MELAKGRVIKLDKWNVTKAIELALTNLDIINEITCQNITKFKLLDESVGWFPSMETNIEEP